MSIQGDWTYNRFHSPVIVDLDNDGDKEIIITDDTSIRVYAYDANDDDDLLFDIIEPDMPEGYSMYGPCAVGDLNGDGQKEIVVVSRKVSIGGPINSNPVDHRRFVYTYYQM